MSVQFTRGKIGVEDLNIAAAGGTFTRVMKVNGVTGTYTPAYFNASSFPFTTANQSTVTGAGYSSTNPSAFAAEIAAVIAEPLADAAALRAITWTPTANQVVVVGDQRRPFIWDSASTTADDGVLFIKVTAITTGRWRAATAGAADSATTATSATSATSATTATTSTQTEGLKTATTTVDIDGATAPSADQVLAATSSTAAAWRNPLAYALKSATTEVSVSAATAPSSGQVLMATASTTATWQTISTAASKATFSDTTTSIPASSSNTSLVVAVGAGKSVCLVWLCNESSSGTGGGGRGAVIIADTTATNSQSVTEVNAFRGNVALTTAVLDATDNNIYVESATYNSGTGDLTLVFGNTNGGSAATQRIYGIAIAV